MADEKDKDFEECMDALQKYAEKKGYVGFSFVITMAKQDGHSMTSGGWRNLNPLFLLTSLVPEMVGGMARMIETARQNIANIPQDNSKMYS